MTITINTDWALLIEKSNKTAKSLMPKTNLFLETKTSNPGAFIEQPYSDVTNKKIMTGPLTNCMAVFVESESQILILHVSPTQAENDKSTTIAAYKHLSVLQKNSDISVTIFGHVKNFKQDIFKKAAKKYTHRVNSLTIEKNPFKDNVMNFSFVINDKENFSAQLSEYNSNDNTMDYEIKNMKVQQINKVNANQTITEEDSDQQNDNSNHNSCCSMM